jgi:hypothetical protein
MAPKTKKKATAKRKPRAEETIVVSPSKVQGGASASVPQGKQPAHFTSVHGTAASAVAAPVAEDPQKKLGASHEFIAEHVVTGSPPTEPLDISKQFKDSHDALGDYVTLDWQHCVEIQLLMTEIHDYAIDRSRRRPLNIIMQAEPGSGKSFFIECLAKNKKMSQDRISDVTFNMATLQGVEDFVQPLDALRNLKVVDKLPILFLDEFDSEKKNYALLLPLLWDGKLGIGHRELRIGKVVIILAGSSPELAKAMRAPKGMQSSGGAKFGKLTDLLSRINGGELTIPLLDEVVGNRDRRVDKVCLTLSLLRQRFGPELAVVPWALLRFVAETKFRYGVRSISHLIDLIPFKDFKEGTPQIADLQLPLETVQELQSSSLASHIVENRGPVVVVKRWNRLRPNETSVRFDKPKQSLLSSFPWKALGGLFLRTAL